MGVGGRPPTSLARILGTALAVVIGAAACTTPPAERGPPRPGPPLTITSSLRLAVGSPGSLDPALLQSPESLNLAAQLFDGLVDYDPETLKAVPAAAQRWEVKDGGRAFTFRLREGAMFHDGTPVVAGDFVFAWNRLADPVGANPFAFLLEAVEGFDRYQEQVSVTGISGLVARDDRTLEVRLAEPWPDFVSLLAHPALSPVPRAAQDPGFSQQPMGNGPYRLTSELVPGGPIRMERFDRYYGDPPAVQTLEFRTFADPQEAWPEFLSGELDVAPVPPDVLPDAIGRFGSRGIVTLARLLYCGFNLEDKRFRDPDIRTAVSLALDRGEIVRRVYGGAAEPAAGIVPPGLPGHQVDVCEDLCRTDLERARDLVAGVPRSSRSFAIDYARSSVGRRLAETLSSQLGEAGLRATPRPHEASEYRELLRSGRQELFCLVQVADYPRQQALLEPLLLSSSPENHTAVDEPALDGVLERARAERNGTAREGLYLEAERRALELMPLVPVAWFRSGLAAQPYVRGFAVDPLGGFDASRLQVAP